MRAYENCQNGVFGENARDIIIELNNPPAVDSLVPGMKADDKNFYDNPGVVLVPGGDYCFAQWTRGFLQLVDTKSQKAVWTYHNVPSAGMAPMLGVDNCLCCDVDFQNDGFATVVTSYCNISSYRVAPITIRRHQF